MGSLEGEIGDAAAARAAQADAPQERPLFRRIENFAVDNVKGIAVGASAGIILLAAATTMNLRWSQPAPMIAADPISVGSVRTETRVPSQPEWQVIRKPVEIMALQAPQVERTPAQYGARRTSRNDREDSLIWQGATPGGVEARIALVRNVAAGSAPSLFVDMTRQQAERGVAVTRAGAPGALMTKFGPLEVADMTFSDASGVSQACLAFRGAPSGDAPMLGGWYCGAQATAVERPEVACFIDRLTLLKGGEDQALRRFFTDAEQKRRPCPNARISAGRKPTWLDHDGRAPRLRDGEETTGSISPHKR
jgi:hypothetical protein